MICIGDKGGVKIFECKDCYININYYGNMVIKWNNMIVLSVIKL